MGKGRGKIYCLIVYPLKTMEVCQTRGGQTAVTYSNTEVTALIPEMDGGFKIRHRQPPCRDKWKGSAKHETSPIKQYKIFHSILFSGEGQIVATAVICTSIQESLVVQKENVFILCSVMGQMRPRWLQVAPCPIANQWQGQKSNAQVWILWPWMKVEVRCSSKIEITVNHGLFKIKKGCLSKKYWTQNSDHCLTS